MWTDTEIIELTKAGIFLAVGLGLSILIFLTVDAYLGPDFYLKKMFNAIFRNKKKAHVDPDHTIYNKFKRLLMQQRNPNQEPPRLCVMNLDEKHPSNVLMFLKIKGLKSIETCDPLFDRIVNRHLPCGDIIKCQEELIDAGYIEYAHL